MISLDAGVLLALTQPQHPQHARVRDMLRGFPPSERFVLSPFAYAELMADPRRDALSALLERMNIRVLEEMPLSAYCNAGGALRRRQESSPEGALLSSPCFIGAHALHHKVKLFTLEPEVYSGLYPTLELLSLSESGVGV